MPDESGLSAYCTWKPQTLLFPILEEQDNSANKAQSTANKNSAGFRHYNDVRIPNLLKLYFFGEDGKDELDQARFDNFCKIIQREVLQQEFRLLMQSDYQDLIQALKEENEDDLGDGEFSPRTQIDLHKTTTAIEENNEKRESHEEKQVRIDQNFKEGEFVKFMDKLNPLGNSWKNGIYYGRSDNAALVKDIETGVVKKRSFTHVLKR